MRIQADKTEVEKIVDTIKKNPEINSERLSPQPSPGSPVNFGENTVNCFSLNADSNLSFKNPYISTKLKFYKSEDMSKIITSANIILNEKLKKIVEINNTLLGKSEALKNYPTLQALRVSIKKKAHGSNEFLDDIHHEVLYIKSIWEQSHMISLLMHEMLKEIFEVKI